MYMDNHIDARGPEPDLMSQTGVVRLVVTGYTRHSGGRDAVYAQSLVFVEEFEAVGT